MSLLGELFVILLLMAPTRHSKKLYAWETAPVEDMALLLLCGDTEFKVRISR